MHKPCYPFESDRYIGSVAQVDPDSVTVNLPQAGLATGRQQHGYRMGCGEVSEFVVLECDDLAIFGRILEVRLPERERLAVLPQSGRTVELHPVGAVQLLATISLSESTLLAGLKRYPRLGARVYSAPPDLVQWVVQDWKRSKKDVPVLFDLAAIPDAAHVPISVTPEQLYGRHCAVLGATGGGKSWTVARIVQQCLRFNCKVIFLDATGEFHTLQSPHVRHCSLGDGPLRPETAEYIEYPFSMLLESDLFAIFTPSGQSQAPKLREAFRSLKLVKLEPKLATKSVIVKMNKSKKEYTEAYEKHSAIVEGNNAEFDINRVSQQITEECVWPTGGTRERPDANSWGAPSTETAHCVSLQMRIDNILSSRHLACIFKPTVGVKTVPDVVSELISSTTMKVLRVSLQNVSYEHNARETLVNALGRHLLEAARAGRFREAPLLVVLDEAHQFLNKSIGDEVNRVYLDSFGLIAKEGRKYGLNVLIATQRPRDIPDDVLSQMGTLVVHRLISDSDRKVVERAAGDIDKAAAAFLPTLGPGEAVIVGVDIPVPLSVKIAEPEDKPDSRGPDYQKHWGPPAPAPAPTESTGSRKTKTTRKPKE
jgi:uncharacterized protein